VKTISTKKGELIFVDDDDYVIISQYTWGVMTNGYVATSKRKPDKGKILLHRLITDAPAGKFVDHKNGNKCDNRKSNLRLCSNQQNQHNQTVRRGKSIFKGVSYHATRKRWYGSICHNNKSIHLGSFDNELDAAKAYNNKAKELFGEFANLNNICP
jgi:hypothetical protein